MLLRYWFGLRHSPQRRSPSLSLSLMLCQCFDWGSPQLSRQTDRVVKMSGPWLGKRPTTQTHHHSSDTDTIACWTEEVTHTLVGCQPKRIYQYGFPLPIIHWSSGIIVCDYDQCCTRLGITRCIQGQCRVSKQFLCWT